MNTPKDQPALAASAGSAFSFALRRPGRRSVAAGRGMKDWPDEWVCQNCAWVKPCDVPRKGVYCRKWNRSVGANSDRMCFEEPLEMKQRREAMGSKRPNSELSNSTAGLKSHDSI